MSSGEEGSVLHFTCPECRFRLGVDVSLAGLTAPCPKCGVEVTAPIVAEKRVEIPAQGVVRGVSKGALPKVVPKVGEGYLSSSSGMSEQRRQIYPTGGRMPDEDEKDNLRAFFKIVTATALVVLAVSLIVWYMNNQ